MAKLPPTDFSAIEDLCGKPVLHVLDKHEGEGPIATCRDGSEYELMGFRVLDVTTHSDAEPRRLAVATAASPRIGPQYAYGPSVYRPEQGRKVPTWVLLKGDQAPIAPLAQDCHPQGTSTPGDRGGVNLAAPQAVDRLVRRKNVQAKFEGGG